VCALVLATTIGGALMGSHNSLHATELDSHANMAVAGSDCTVIAPSGCHATVTPFSSNLPTMDMVEGVVQAWVGQKGQLTDYEI
jgi:hypothetical protein